MAENENTFPQGWRIVCRMKTIPTIVRSAPNMEMSITFLSSTSVSKRLSGMMLGGLLLLSGMLIAQPATATPNTEDAAAIEYLIRFVSESDMVFVRNFGKHEAKRAAGHIRDKYEHFEDEIDSPEEFIELSASKSLLTGRKYTVIDPQGIEIESRDWLLDELQAYRADPSRAASK
jgi:hypothetical protein